MTIRLFFYPDFTRYVLFTADALAHMYGHIQCRPWHKEAGGELFANDPNAAGLVVTAAAGPNPSDRRNRRSWNPDTEGANQDRQQQYVLGRHAVGLWHTHPEPSPSPSGLDQRTTGEYLAAFHGDRARYLMVILGNRGIPTNMTVWVASSESRNTWIELAEASASCTLETIRLKYPLKVLAGSP